MQELVTARLRQGEMARILALEAELQARLVVLAPAYGLATLTADQLRQLREREGELNTVLIAYQPSDRRLADVEPSELDQISALEQRLGCALLAYEDEPRAGTYMWQLGSDHRVAELSEGKLSRLTAVEAELGVIILAYDSVIYAAGV